MIDNNLLQKDMQIALETCFKNEGEFISKFFSSGPRPREILSIYLSAYGTRVSFLDNNYEEQEKFISTNTLFDWVKEKL